MQYSSTDPSQTASQSNAAQEKQRPLKVFASKLLSFLQGSSNYGLYHFRFRSKLFSRILNPKNAVCKLIDVCVTLLFYSSKLQPQMHILSTCYIN